MFDNLIGNLDPNQGNWLVDPAWNLILIDHTRAFTTDKGLVHKKFSYIDGPLWEKMQALTLETLTASLWRLGGAGRAESGAASGAIAWRAEFDKQIAANPDFVIK